MTLCTEPVRSDGIRLQSDFLHLSKQVQIQDHRVYYWSSRVSHNVGLVYLTAQTIKCIQNHLIMCWTELLKSWERSVGRISKPWYWFRIFWFGITSEGKRKDFKKKMCSKSTRILILTHTSQVSPVPLWDGDAFGTKRSKTKRKTSGRRLPTAISQLQERKCAAYQRSFYAQVPLLGRKVFCSSTTGSTPTQLQWFLTRHTAT